MVRMEGPGPPNTYSGHVADDDKIDRGVRQQDVKQGFQQNTLTRTISRKIERGWEDVLSMLTMLCSKEIELAEGCSTTASSSSSSRYGKSRTDTGLSCSFSSSKGQSMSTLPQISCSFQTQLIKLLKIYSFTYQIQRLNFRYSIHI